MPIMRCAAVHNAAHVIQLPNVNRLRLQPEMPIYVLTYVLLLM